MTNKEISNTIGTLKKDSDFYTKYLETFMDRFIWSTVDIEDEVKVSKRRKIFKDTLKAFKYALCIGGNMDYFDIQDIGNIINEGNDNIAKGYRKIDVTAGNMAIFSPADPENIRYKIYSLLDNYNNIWKDLDIFEKEAMFHINLMRIHPFEDGNKRTTKIILNANLLKNNQAPVVIVDEDNKLYYNFINNEDYKGFAEFLRQRSEIERLNMISLYKIMSGIPIDKEAERELKRGKVREVTRLKQKN